MFFFYCFFFSIRQGSWDSIHVIEVSPQAGTNKASYKLTSTLMLNMNVNKPQVPVLLLLLSAFCSFRVQRKND